MGHELFYSSKVGRGTGEFTMDFCRQINIIGKVMNSHRQEDKMRRWNIITEEMVSFDYKPQEYLRHYIAPQYPFFEMTKEGMKLLTAA